MRDGVCGLIHIHSFDLVHIDFKPENLLVVKTGRERRGKVTDFGLSRCEWTHPPPICARVCRAVCLFFCLCFPLSPPHQSSLLPSPNLHLSSTTVIHVHVSLLFFFLAAPCGPCHCRYGCSSSRVTRLGWAALYSSIRSSRHRYAVIPMADVFEAFRRWNLGIQSARRRALNVLCGTLLKPLTFFLAAPHVQYFVAPTPSTMPTTTTMMLTPPPKARGTMRPSMTGTAAYMPPKNLTTDMPADFDQDAFSAAVVTLLMLLKPTIQANNIFALNVRTAGTSCHHVIFVAAEYTS